jgi:class 3 adenylate cyclase/tetratricopeptide (TPR) repeat protein
VTTTELVSCTACGAEVPRGQRFCGACGEPLGVGAVGDELHRAVTVVTSDLKGSTALGERLDPESLREVMTTYLDEMRAVFEGHGGTIEKIIGDAIVAVYGLPVPRDDDALRAVEAAAESQRALASLNDQLEARWGVRLTVRTGVASGDVVVGAASSGQHVLAGATLAIATAMEQNAPPQEVLLAASTLSAVGDAIRVEPMGPVQPKGWAEPIETYRLVSVAERAAPPEEPSNAGARICSTCGEENRDEQGYCVACGSQLAVRGRVRDTRKTVTVVFADPKPTTADGSPPAPEALRDVMSRYFAGMQRALERHGATVEKFIGDAVMAVFGLPIRHEDDALRAVRAAADMQEALPGLNEAFAAEHGITLHNHIGVNTGEVVAGDASLGQRLVTGDVVNVAARLEQAAGAREVLLGDLTYRLVRDAVEVEPVEPLALKGKAEPVPAFRLLRVRRMGDAVERRQDTPMVGREAEMGALRAIMGRAVEERACRMATVVGDAGVGKSRLIREFTARAAAEADVIHGRCLPYGEGITFWPLREAVHAATGITADDAAEAALAKLRARVPDEAVADRLASVIGLSESPFPVPEIFWAARKLLEGLSRDRPVLVVIDDIHWAEATFLELIGHLVEAIEDAPVLLLCSSRRELLDRQPDWAQDGASLRLVLSPLTDADAGRVVEALLGGTGIDASVRGRIVQAAAGNPLFVEQLLSMLIDEGILRREEDLWVQAGDLGRLRVPPTIEALLAARLDLLETDERGVIEPAAVIGQHFAVPAVTDLVAEPIAPRVPAHLEALTAKQLVQPNPDADEREAGYRFHHILVRDAAYGGLLKRERADLHERFVSWAEGFNAAHGVDDREFEEIHGYHLEQAYRYLAELGTVDDHALDIGVRASQKLASAGRRAMARGDMPAAASLLRRAAATRLEHDAERLRLLPDLGEALEELGQFDEAQRVLEEAVGAARDRGDAALAAEATMVLLSVKLYLGEEEGWADAVQRETAAAIPVFEAAGDHVGLARANRLRFAMLASATRLGPASAAAEEVIGHARRAGDARLERRGSLAYAQAALYGPTPVQEAIPDIERLVAAAGDDRQTQSLLATWLAQLYAMNGELERARQSYATASAVLRDLGGGLASSSTSVELAQIELLGGDLRAAEEALRRDHEALLAIGERYILSGVVGLLAKVLVAQGRYGEVEELARTLQELAAEEDTAAQVDWRALCAVALARAGRTDEAEALAREAVALAATAEVPTQQAEAHLRLADVLAIAGRSGEASAEAATARRLYAAKGDVVSAAAVPTFG